MKLALSVNGAATSWSCPTLSSVLDLLRETGETMPEPCAEGRCGACAVLLRGQVVNACVVPAHQAQGKELLTAAGLGEAGQRMVAVLAEHGACACGVCRDGTLMVLEELRRRDQVPDESTLREALAATRCGCGTYPAMLAAAKEVLGVDERR